MATLPGLVKDTSPPATDTQLSPISIPDGTTLLTTKQHNKIVDYLSGDAGPDFIPQNAIDSLVSDLAGKEDSLGFTPENIANKGAVSGYAGLDASQELLLTNFPSGIGLQVLRRNSGNTALEFVTLADLEGVTSINGDGTAAQIIAGTTNRISLVDAGDTHTFDIDAAYVGQASIITLGTITTGTWQGTVIATAFVATTLTGKTLTTATITQPVLTLTQSTTPTPTAEGVIEWDTDNNLMAIGDGATTLLFSDDTVVEARANHTGTQLASTISDFDSAVTANTNVTANTAKVTNQTHTGDVTGSIALTITADAVTYSKMQNVVSNNVILGNIAGAGGIVTELTGTQVTVLLDVFTPTLKGLAPLSGGGTTNFLRADGSWAAPAGGDVSLWASFDASEDVDMAANNIADVGTITASIFQVSPGIITADDGEFRLRNDSSIKWRNNANDGNLALEMITDRLQFGGDFGVSGLLIFDLLGTTFITEVNGDELEFQVEDQIGLRIFNSAADLQSVILGKATQLATTVTDGFLYISNMAGVPTGVPTVQTGKTAIVFDDTNDDLYAYDGTGWLLIGAGDVAGPAVAVDNAITRFNGTTGKLIQSSGITISDTDVLAGISQIQVDATGKIGMDGSSVSSYIAETSDGIVDIFANAQRCVRFRQGADGVDAIMGGSGAIMSQLDTEGFLFMPSWGNASAPAGTPSSDPTGYGATGISFTDGSFQLYGFNGSAWKTIASTIGKQNVTIDIRDVFPSPSGGASAVNDKTPVTSMTFPTIDFAHSVDETVEFSIMLPTTRDQSVNPDIELFWYYQNAESGDDVVWGAEIAAFNGFDNMVGKTYGTRTEFEGTSVQELVVNSAQLTDIDDNGLGSAGLMHVRITRIGTDGNDTLDQDAILFGIRITYTTETGIALS